MSSQQRTNLTNLLKRFVDINHETTESMVQVNGIASVAREALEVYTNSKNNLEKKLSYLEQMAIKARDRKHQKRMERLCQALRNSLSQAEAGIQRYQEATEAIEDDRADVQARHSEQITNAAADLVDFCKSLT